MGNKLTLIEVSMLTDLHTNTLRKYLKTGELKGKKVEDKTGRPVWVVDEDDLYGCEAPTIINTLSPKKARRHQSYSERIAELEGAVDDLTGEISRLEGELEESSAEGKRLKEETEKRGEQLEALGKGSRVVTWWFHEAIKMLPERKVAKLFRECKIQHRYEIEDPETMEEWRVTFTAPGCFEVYVDHTRKMRSDGFGSFLYNQEIYRREGGDEYHH
ncbi:MAG: hypothetical protein KJ625_07900 [Actinobacteria bacterium]|nr:hypothetical protein [Actinomycetota bacterium]MBU4179842.1 hypothetical protein [Actinomycetota bacterium]